MSVEIDPSPKVVELVQTLQSAPSVEVLKHVGNRINPDADSIPERMQHPIPQVDVSGYVLATTKYTYLACEQGLLVGVGGIVSTFTGDMNYFILGLGLGIPPVGIGIVREHIITHYKEHKKELSA